MKNFKCSHSDFKVGSNRFFSPNIFIINGCNRKKCFNFLRSFAARVILYVGNSEKIFCLRDWILLFSIPLQRWKLSSIFEFCEMLKPLGFLGLISIKELCSLDTLMDAPFSIWKIPLICKHLLLIVSFWIYL